MRYLVLGVWFISLNIVISNCIHFIAKVGISLFLWLNSIPLCIIYVLYFLALYKLYNLREITLMKMNYKFHQVKVILISPDLSLLFERDCQCYYILFTFKATFFVRLIWILAYLLPVQREGVTEERQKYTVKGLLKLAYCTH